MPSYSEERQKEQMALIKEILIIKQTATVLEVQKILEEKRQMHLDKKYIGKLFKKIRGERATRYENANAKEALANFEDLMGYLKNELIKIKNNTTSDMVKTIAIKNISQIYKDLLNLQLDFGIFERKLGTLKADIDVLGILTEIENAKQNKTRDSKNDDGGAK
jgi:hypothetical protein